MHPSAYSEGLDTIFELCIFKVLRTKSVHTELLKLVCKGVAMATGGSPSPRPTGRQFSAPVAGPAPKIQNPVGSSTPSSAQVSKGADPTNREILAVLRSIEARMSSIEVAIDRIQQDIAAIKNIGPTMYISRKPGSSEEYVPAKDRVRFT